MILDFRALLKLDNNENWYYFGTPQSQGYCFQPQHPSVGGVPKPVPHKKKGTEIAPLGAPNYGQPNSTPRGAVLAPFFLSV